MPLARNEVLADLTALREELARRFSVRRIGLFGSLAHGDATDTSDIDLLVELAEPTYDHFMDLKFLLEERFGRRVDLVLADDIKPRLKPVIEREVVYA
jgi:hypothetical protein